MALLTLILTGSSVLPSAAAIAANATPSTVSRGPGSGDPRNGAATVRAAADIASQPGGMSAGATIAGDASVRLRPHFAPVKPPKVPTAVKSLWTETTRTTANPDGTFVLEASAGRMNYRDPSGTWQPIDLTLVPDDSGGYGLRVKANDRSVRFGQGGAEQALAQLVTDKGTLRVRALDFAGAAARPGVGPDHGRVRFSKDASTGQVFVQATDTGFEFGAELADGSASNRYAFAIEGTGVEVSVADDGQTLVLTRTSAADGRGDGTVVGSISAPVVLDADEVPAPASAVHVELFDPASGRPAPDGVSAEALTGLHPHELAAVYTIDPAWLSAADRAFPVVLDPSACLGAGASGCDINHTSSNIDHFIGSGIADVYPINWTTFRVGYDSRSDDGDTYGTMRGLVYFGDVSLPDGAVVYDTNLGLHVSSEYGGPSGETMVVDRILKGWGQTTTWSGFTAGSEYTGTGEASLTVPSSGTMNFDVDAIVQTWYTRRVLDWKQNIGFYVRMASGSEGSGHGEVEFDRYNDATASYRPKLTISYEVPKVAIDFDPALGPNYSPSTMIASKPTILPIRVSNQSSGFDFTTANWLAGYRFFDAKGNLKGSGQQVLPQCVGTGTGCVATSATFGLNITPPSTTGQYTLRLDIVRNGTFDQSASDWAKPSTFYSRNKKVLNADNTRWTGSSPVERDEFSIGVVAGDGGQGEVHSVSTGDGGSLGVDLWSGNLSYAGSGGVEFGDLQPMSVDYGYDSKNVGDCLGVLKACGWGTNWDERFITGSSAGSYTYVDPSGNRYLVDSDGDQQLVSGAPVLLQRQRTTLFDENVPTNSPTVALVAPPGGAFSGQYAVRAAAGTVPGIGVGGAGTTDINTYRYARFAVKADVAQAGIAFKIHNVSDNTDKWWIYRVGATDWSTGFEGLFLNNGAINTGNWVYYNRDLYSDVRNNGTFGSTYDDFQVTAVQIQNKTSGAAGYVYLDALRLEPGQTQIIDETNPSWSSGGTLTSLVGGDVALGSQAVRINQASIASSPDCNTTAPTTPCWGTSAGGLYTFGFIHWQWRKVGGQSAALVLHLKDVRTNATGDLTYYAGPAAPAGAVNPIQVSDVPPVGWSKVTRNLLEDARQVLNFFNDNPTGTSPSSPPSQGPSPDDVKLIGFKPSAVDGNFLLWDDFAYSSLPDVGSGQLGHPSTTTDATFTYDYTATYRDGSIHYFNNVGLLKRIADLDHHVVALDWIVDPAVIGAGGWKLDRIHAATDGLVSGGNTYDREIDVSYPTGSNRIVSFTEQLGTTATPIVGRTTTFTIASAAGTGYGTGDLISVKPARAPACAAPGSATGCVSLTYTDTTSHLLAMLGDPRWDQTSTSGTNDRRFEVTWTSGSPTAISDRSTAGGPTPIFRVVNYNTGSALPSASRAVWQDEAQLRQNAATYTDLTSDGKLAIEYIPLTCQAANCATPPLTSGLATQRARESQFDGLSRISTSVAYRCPGVAVSGCAGTAQKVTSRQGTKAGAKIDNYNDPLTAGQVGWTQSADQYVASLRDSNGQDADLYRTFYGYDEDGQQVSLAKPVHNERPDYAAAVLSTAPAAGNLTAYYRLGETTGNPANSSSAGSTYNGTATAITYGDSGALVGDANKAFRFTGTSKVTSSAPLSQTAYTIEAWIRATTANQTDKGLAGRFSGGGAMLWLDASGYYTLPHTGTATNYLHSTVKPRVGAFDHVVATWDGSMTRLYVNGALVAQMAMTAAPGTTGTVFEIGTYAARTQSMFVGDIDEVALYNVALNAQQVSSHYEAGHAIVLDTVNTIRDKSWRPLQTDDQALSSSGFESGLSTWDVAGGATLYTATNPVGDGFTHQPADPSLPASWAALKTNQSGSASQTVQLLPGQTARVQAFDKTTGTAQAVITAAYWKRSTQAWTTIATGTYPDTTPGSHAWDVTLPFDTDGRLRLTLGVTGAGASDSVYYDDAAVLTSYGRTTYTSIAAGDLVEGLARDTLTFSPSSGSAIGEFVARTTYTGTATTPPIFKTKVTSNFVDGTFSASSPDTDVSTTWTVDAWGRETASTDQDGVTTITDYASTPGANGYLTDIADTKDGMTPPDVTQFSYDEVGNKRSTTTPKNETTSTTYDLRNHVLVTTDPAPISTKTKNVYDGYGFKTGSIANQVDDTPSGPNGLDDVVTTYVYDEFGELSSTTQNTGVSGVVQARTTRTHDLLGNDVASTVYATFDGTTFGAPRTTTQYLETSNGAWRAKPSAKKAPGSAVATGTPPACPDGSGATCTSVDVLDQDGQPVTSTDAYGVITRTFRDIAGKAVIVIANYGDGVYSSAAPDVDLVAIVQNDLFGRPAVKIDSLNRKTVTTYDALGRTVRSTVYDWDGSAGHPITDTRTAYTGGGKVDRVSLPGTAVDGSGTPQPDSTFTWTKTIYDKAGRAIKTLAHYEIGGAAGIALDSFETPETDVTIDGDGSAESWSAAAGTFIAGGGSAVRDAAAASAKSGAGRLSVTTGSVASTGAEWLLDGTFTSGHVYKARVWVNPPSGVTVDAKLGTASSSAPDAAPVVGNGTWQPLDVTWTGNGASGVRLAVYRAAAGVATFSIDDAAVWDSTSGFTDVNIPTETAYDADGQVVASVVAPGSLGGTEEPLVTRTAYDALGRTTTVTVDEVAGGGTSAPDVNLSTTTTYDALGRTDTKTDPTGTITKYGYDRLGRQTSATLNYVDGTPTNGTSDDDVTSRFGYDAAGEMTGYCSPAQVFVGGCDENSATNVQAWHYVYDDAANVTIQTPPVNTTAQALATQIWQYDAGGRLTKACSAPAGTTTCTAGGVLRTTVPSYDAAGRTKRTDVYAGPSTTLSIRIDTVFLGDGQPASTTLSTGATPTVVDAISYGYDSSGRQTKVTRTATSTILSERSYNDDGTIAWRKDGDDNAIGQTSFGYDWADRLISADLPDSFSAAVPTFGWRLDGLIGSRTWSGSTATFAYDASKRVTSLTKGAFSQTQTYDRDGNVKSEGRTFGFSGDAGTGTQSFTYDNLGRVTQSSGLASGQRAYTYDRDSNRLSKTEGGVTFSFTYDRTDELTTVIKTGGTTQSFAYDPYGNMTTDAETAAALTAFTYDLGDKLTGIDAAGTANDASFTFDAFGRFLTRILGGGTSTDTYSYLDTSELVARISNSVGGATDSIVSATGDRLGVKVGTTLNWFLPDLHGDIAGSLDSGGGTMVNAIRYDAYGQTITTGSAGGIKVGEANWKYQGRLDISPAGLGTPLYDMSARFYDPGLGAFTQLDTVKGSAQNPLSMNRYLYAAANPWTLTDPTGHCWGICIDINININPLDVVGAVVSTAVGVAAGAAVAVVASSVGVAAVAAGAAAGAVGAVASDVVSGRGVRWESALSGAVSGGVAVASFGAALAVTHNIAASAAISGAAAGAAGDIVNQGIAFAQTGGKSGFSPEEVALSAGLGGLFGFAGAKIGPRIGAAADHVRGPRGEIDVVEPAPRAGNVCANSFDGTTLVATPSGGRSIASLRVGDVVTAINPLTGALSARAISALHVNADPITGTVSVAGEDIRTTPEHPFLTTERGWVLAQDLQIGEHVVSATAHDGRVSNVTFGTALAVMFNLTVDGEHTYLVGEGEWAVHNCAPQWEPKTNRWRDPESGRFVSGEKPDSIVIGENMDDRVIPAAKALTESTRKPVGTYRPRSGVDTHTPDGMALAKARQEHWIESQMNKGKTIYDRGIDPYRSPARGRSPFYAIERMAIARRNYGRVIAL